MLGVFLLVYRKECLKGLLNMVDQCPQIAQWKFREITVHMSRGKGALIDEPARLVFGDATTLLIPRHNERFPPRIDQLCLPMVDDIT